MTMIIDGSSGATFPDSSVQAVAGKVLQVVSATYSTRVSSSSSTFGDTGLTASITPKFSTSKILVLVNIAGCGKDTSDTFVMLKLLRGSTSILDFERLAGYNNATTRNFIGACSASYLDSPATTSSTTYKVQMASGGNSPNAYMNTDGNGSSPTSTITLMEIAA